MSMSKSSARSPPAAGGENRLGGTTGNHNSRADKSSGVKSKHDHPRPPHGDHFLQTAIDGILPAGL